jgi:nucleotide-binding universal stress UspA family protein
MSLLGNVLVPVATVDDARTTAVALARYDSERITVMYVVEKGGGVPDKTPVEQSRTEAAESFEAFAEVFAEAATEVRYGTDVTETVFETAADLDSTVIAFLPRGRSRFVQLLSGDRALDLITESDRPVVALPAPAGDGSD